MPLEYAKANALAKDAAFIDRVEACITANAKSISLSTGETLPRKDIAYNALLDSRNWAVRFAGPVALDPGVATTVQATILDTVINGAVQASWNAFRVPAS